MRLELGAGDRPTNGFTHQDARALPGIDIIGDATEITSHPDIGEGLCSEIRATHLLEHFSFKRTVDILKEWSRALMPGGILYIEVPHIFGHVAALNRNEISPEEFVIFVYGDQEYEGGAHFAGFSVAMLHKVLADAGYENIQIQDIGMVLCATSNKPR